MLNVEVLHDLFRRQYAVVYCYEPERTLEESLTGDFAAKHECKCVLPVHQRAGLYRICLCNEIAVDIDAASADRIIIHDNVLQGCLENFVCGRRRQCRVAVQAGFGGTQQEVVVVQRLLQSKVTSRVAAGVADDARHLLCHISRHNPRFDRVFAGSLDQVMELPACRSSALRLTVIDRDAPSAEPIDIA